MADLPSRDDLADALAAAGLVHEAYERDVFRGHADEGWPGFYAAYVLGRVGEFTEAARLAQLIAEVDTADDWSAVAADHILMKLRS